MRFVVTSLAVRILAAVTGLVLVPAVAPAAPLDEVVCKDLDARLKQLELDGVKDDLAKGPEFAKANVTMARLAVIKDYIETKEQVAFRCPSLIVVSVPELAEPEAKHPLAEPGKAAEPKSSKSTKKTKKRQTIEIEVPTPPAKKATKAE